MYKFKKLDNNNEFLLTYDDKQIKFRRIVNDAKKLESINAVATMKAIEELSKQGYTIDNNPYIVERTENGKIIRDESNWNYILKLMTDQATAEIFQEMIADKLNITLEQLVTDVLKVDMNDQADIEKKTLDFMTKFITIIKTGEVEDNQTTPIRNN
jgi:hypothetical protein